eukprot:gene7824-9635_t
MFDANDDQILNTFNTDSDGGKQHRKLVPAELSVKLEGAILPDIDRINPNVTHLILDADFNEILSKGKLGSNLRQLTFGLEFNLQIPIGMLPPAGLTHIRFGYRFNQIILPGSLPSTLTHLVFDFYYNQRFLKGSLPESLEYLEFKGNEFNQPIEKDTLPKGLLVLKFGSNFNQPIEKDTLPSGLVELRFGFHFCQSLEIGSIPDRLITLELGSKFRCQRGLIPESVKTLIWNSTGPISEGLIPVIPDSVTTLCFGTHYNYPIMPGVLHNGLLHLELGLNYNKELLVGSIPSTVTTLKIGNFLAPFCNGVIPLDLKYLSCGPTLTSSGNQYTNFPIGRQTYQLVNSNSSNIVSSQFSFPPQLHRLYLNGYFIMNLVNKSTGAIPKIPNTVKRLSIILDIPPPTQSPPPIIQMEEERQILLPQITIPNSVEYLEIANFRIEPNTIPSSVKKLTIHKFSEELISDLENIPSATVQHLAFKVSFPLKTSHYTWKRFKSKFFDENQLLLSLIIRFKRVSLFDTVVIQKFDENYFFALTKDNLKGFFFSKDKPIIQIEHLFDYLFKI